jgi:hypothetical protein
MSTRYTHHDGNGALVGHCLEPLGNTFLTCSRGKVARREHHAVFCTGLFGILELDQSVLYVLRCSTGNDGSVVETSLVKLLALAADELVPLLVGEMNGLAGGPQDNQTADATLDQEDGVFCLRLQIQRVVDGMVV